MSGNIGDKYTSTWACTGGVTSSGTGTTGALTVPSSGSAATVCTFTNTPKNPSWSLTKSSDPASGSVVVPGQVITYSVVAKNTSLVTLPAQTVTDNLSNVLNNAGFVAGSINLPSEASLSGNTLTWDVPSLAAGDSKTLTYQVKVKDTATNVTLKNVVTTTGGTPLDPCPQNNPKCRETEHKTPSWSLVKSSNPVPGSIDPGAQTSLTGTTLTWNVPAVAAGGSTSVSYKVTVNAGAYGVTLKNLATGSGSVPPQTCPTGSQSCSTTHDTDPAWSLVKSSDPVSGSTVKPGDSITYKLTATNLSLEAALEGYVAVDDLSDVLNNAVLDEAGLPAGVSYDAATQTLRWAVPTLEAGKSATVSYKVTVNATAIGVTLKNVVAAGGKTPPPVDCPAEDPNCRTTEHFTPELSVDKTVLDAKQNVDGTWTVRYNVKVENVARVATTYSLTDTLQFGAGITVNSATWSGHTEGTFAGNTGALAVDKPIAAGNTTHVYTVTANATVAPDAWNDGEAQLSCPGPESSDKGGFLNTASLTFPGSQEESKACTEPGVPNVDKTFDSAVQSDTDPSQWFVTYTLKVTGDSQWPTVYSLKDVPGFAEGATPVSGTWQRVDTDPAGPVTAIGAGGVIVEGSGIDAEAVHTYRVIWTVDVPNGVDPDVQECTVPGEAGNGYFNEAVLTSGGHEQKDDACGPIDTVVRPGVEKTVTGLTQNDNGSWDVTYDVVVTLPTGEEENPKGLSAKYDLIDVLDFGANITVESASWSGGGAVDQPFVDGSAEMASGAVITPEEPVHTYTVKVNALVDNEAFEDGTAYCEAESETGSGFLNRVTLISSGTEVEDQACTEPPAPQWSLEKTSNPVSGSSVKAGEKVTYTLKVTNTSDEADLHGAVVVDDLSDVLKHAALTGDLAAGLTAKGSTLTWAVPVVKAGESVSVSYTVTVNKGVANVQFKNVAIPDSPGGECLPGKCSTTHKVPPTPVTPGGPGRPSLPRTGATVGSILLSGLVLGAIGFGLKRRSRMGA